MPCYQVSAEGACICDGTCIFNGISIINCILKLHVSNRPPLAGWGQHVHDSWGCPGGWHFPGPQEGPLVLHCPMAMCPGAEGLAISLAQGDGVFWGLCLAQWDFASHAAIPG